MARVPAGGRHPGGVKYRQPMQLLRNLRDGTFEDISVSSGLAQIPLACRRALLLAMSIMTATLT